MIFSFLQLSKVTSFLEDIHIPVPGIVKTSIHLYYKTIFYDLDNASLEEFYVQFQALVRILF